MRRRFAFLFAVAPLVGVLADPHLAFADEDEPDAQCKEELEAAKKSGEAAKACQVRVDSMITNTAVTSTWLTQLSSYQAGELENFPPLRPGMTDRGAFRLAANSGRAYHRRLIIQALELIAPTEWSKIKAGGPTAIDTWFAKNETLDTKLVAEAQTASTAPAGLAGPPLTAALHLVGAFQIAAQCRTLPLPSGECTRARQIQQLLESTGSLVVRRRVQEIWATECSSLAPERVAPWVDEFPTAHVGDAANPWTDVADAAQAKLFSCYLDESTAKQPFGGWMAAKLPPAADLTAAKLQRVDAIRKQWSDTSREAACARAVRAMQTLEPSNLCEVSPAFKDAIGGYIASQGKTDDVSSRFSVCSQFASLLWQGKAASIDGSFTRPPSMDEMVNTANEVPPTPMAKLRAQCQERRNTVTNFPTEMATFSTLGQGLGEAIDRVPFRVDPTSHKPLELIRYESSLGAKPWFEHVTKETRACGLLGLDDERCKACATEGPDSAFDCALVSRLESSWSNRTNNLLGAGALLLAALFGATWLRRMFAARRAYRAWSQETSVFLDGIGLQARPESWRYLLPSRFDTLEMTLPSDPAWDRWGKKAALVRVPPGRRVLERDVNHGAFVARRLGASVVVIEHDDDASSDLSAIRAMLEWAAKGGSRAIQILPIGGSRLRWSKSASDVLDLVEESSLRGNPFELRGRVATSTQFFNRERLVSGLLAAAQAGHWVVVTGLRRFGKSSLTLEVARRLPGPAAYVDVSGFDHEIVHKDDPGAAVEAILRFVCSRLVESARARWPAAEMPEVPAEGSSLDAAALTQWFRDLSRACKEAAGRAPPLLVVLDELEQALAVGPDKLAHALDVLAILVGRLKSAVGEAAIADGGSPMGVILSSALHPLLWAPLRTLAHQSIMGSFQRVCVPCLGDDAASTMMRSLGARQGIRFNDAALARMVEESQGVPLLLRRLGSSVLELYDAERARQGSLGAVDVGIEGTQEAIAREEREGSPLRVWVESEIAPHNTVTGALLHHLAREETVSVKDLSALATKMVASDFAITGIDRTLAPHELSRRAEEAGHVIVQLLHESGLLVPHGDLTAPDAYSLPEGTIRRILCLQEDVRLSAYPGDPAKRVVTG